MMAVMMMMSALIALSLETRMIIYIREYDKETDNGINSVLRRDIKSDRSQDAL